MSAFHALSARGLAGGRPRRLELGQPVAHWPAGAVPRGRALGASLLFLLLLATGCGGATAPCPTPTTELDELRTTSERLEGEMDAAGRAEDTVGEEREETLRRLAEAQAALDSIADTRPR